MKDLQSGQNGLIKLINRDGRLSDATPLRSQDCPAFCLFQTGRQIKSHAKIQFPVRCQNDRMPNGCITSVVEFHEVREPCERIGCKGK